MIWKIKDFLEFETNSQKNLTKTSPERNDYMREACLIAYKRKKGSYIAIALYKQKTLIGWAMLDFFLSRNSTGVRTYIYVKPIYRRNGYGSKILQKAKETAKKMGRTIRVIPHNKISTKFFNYVKIDKSEVVKGYSLKKYE
jgi:GNAT superfamily N-acetyltransferase